MAYFRIKTGIAEPTVPAIQIQAEKPINFLY